jgi:CO/xanthine dehydrogenase FAD-binding subunit
VRGDLRALEVARPKRLSEALALLGEPERPTPLAGGTDLWVALNDGKQPSRRYLDLSRLDELRGMTVSPAGLRLGARTTFTELRRSGTIARRAPVLAAMSATVGAAAIQNRGTLGGSLGNASPASDPAPVLLALDARVELSRRDGRTISRRFVPLDRYFTGYRTTAAASDELITAIEIPAASLSGWRYAYRKVGTRRAQAISKVVAAVGISTVPRGGACAGARIAWGSVAPTTIRASAAERALVGRRLDVESATAAAAALVSDDLRPIDDLRSTAFYRSTVASRLLLALAAELGGFSASPLLER